MKNVPFRLQMHVILLVVCGARCPKVVGATSSEGFLVYPGLQHISWVVIYTEIKTAKARQAIWNFTELLKLKEQSSTKSLNRFTSDKTRLSAMHENVCDGRRQNCTGRRDLATDRRDPPTFICATLCSTAFLTIIVRHSGSFIWYLELVASVLS